MQSKRWSGKRSLVLIAAVVFLGCLGLLVSGCVDDPHAYLWDGRTVEELPNTLGGATSEANDVNAWDWAVGWAADETGAQRAVIWKCGRMFALPSLWDGESVALAINDLGQAVGWERDPSGFTHAVMWSLGKTRDLAKSSWTSSRAYDINNLGQIVGSFEREDSSRPFSWRCGRVTEFPEVGEAYTVNLQGSIAGSIYGEGGLYEPWLYRWGRTTILPEEDDGGEIDGSAEGLNDKGVAAGWVGSLAVTWSRGVMTVLPLPPGMASGAAYDINLPGDVVGEVGTSSYASYAAIWSGGEVRLIPSLGDGSLENYANAINIRGHVVGASEKDGSSNGPSPQLGLADSMESPDAGREGVSGRATILLYDAEGALIAGLNDATTPAVRSAEELLVALAQPPYADTVRVVLRLEWEMDGRTETSDWVFVWQDGTLRTLEGDPVLPH